MPKALPNSKAAGLFVCLGFFAKLLQTVSFPLPNIKSVREDPTEKLWDGTGVVEQVPHEIKSKPHLNNNLMQLTTCCIQACFGREASFFSLSRNSKHSCNDENKFGSRENCKAADSRLEEITIFSVKLCHFVITTRSFSSLLIIDL